MYPTKNDLSEAARAKIIDLCNGRLADAIDLQTQCKYAHWNVKGPNFIALHELFDKINEDVDGKTRRTRKANSMPIASMGVKWRMPTRGGRRSGRSELT